MTDQTRKDQINFTSNGKRTLSITGGKTLWYGKVSPKEKLTVSGSLSSGGDTH